MTGAIRACSVAGPPLIEALDMPVRTTACYLDPATGDRFPLDPPRWCSPARTPLMLEGLAGLRRGQIESSLRSLWRYRAALPFDTDPVSLGEGCTPMRSSKAPARGRSKPDSSVPPR